MRPGSQQRGIKRFQVIRRHVSFADAWVFVHSFNSRRRFPAFMQSISSNRMIELSGTEFIAFFNVRSFSSVRLTT